ncbi:MAG: hypothetical protein KH420_05215 [Clostridiales bacterium]|nr:hypothetical protein [Clostridiales bacterium]
MKQGTIFFRILTVGVLVVILAYLGSSGLKSMQDTLLTTIAVEYEAGDTYLASGYLVRDEQVLHSDAPITIPTLSEGAKVGVGQVVANCYTSSDAQQRHAEIEALEQQRQQLTYVSTSATNATDAVTLDDSIRNSLFAIAVHVNRRELSDAQDLSSDLKSLVLRRYSDEATTASLSAEINALTAQIQELTSQSSQSIQSITVSRSGCFSGYVDGYESILTPDALRSLTVSKLQQLEGSAQADETAFGKMVYGNTWYFVTAIPENYAQDLDPGASLSVSFIQGLSTTISMNIERIGDVEQGQCLLVLSCDEFLSDITALRQQSVNLIFNSYAGLRVPKEAVRMVDGVTGVFVLEGSAQKWKPITILGDTGEHYIVENDRTDTDNLWPGDEIIVSGTDLEDGKVVE